MEKNIEEAAGFSENSLVFVWIGTSLRSFQAVLEGLSTRIKGVNVDMLKDSDPRLAKIRGSCSSLHFAKLKFATSSTRATA